MRFNHKLAAGLLVVLAVMPAMRAEADGPLLGLLHHNQCYGHGDCEVKQSVVRLPAQEIRIDTAAPHITVGSSHHRTRGLVAGQMAFMPVATGPFVATILPGVTVGTQQQTVGNPALRALHEMEMQASEAAAAMAAQRAQMDHLVGVQKRVQAGIAGSFGSVSSSSSSDCADLKASVDKLEKRIGDIERLLIIHDNILKETTPKK